MVEYDFFICFAGLYFQLLFSTCRLNQHYNKVCCLPQGVKHGRNKNMFLKVTPVLTTVNLIKGLSFEATVH